MDSPAFTQYSVRRSQRAKRLQLRILPSATVEVVLPQRMSERHVAPFVAQHQQWILKTLSNMAQRQAAMADGLRSVPEHIELLALGQTWNVAYAWNGKRKLLARDTTLHVQAADEPTARELLRQWLRKQAKDFLIQRLDAVSAQTGFGYRRATIRAQKTRWGSCSTDKNINLNRDLVFLPLSLVDYLCLHELCHTVHLNHSPRYWRLVESCDPDYRQRDKALRRAWKYVPQWVYQ